MAERYNLRNRDEIRMPARYSDDEAAETGRKITRARAQCEGKKKSIMSRIDQIKDIILNRRSRTKVSTLRAQMQKVHLETVAIHKRLLDMVQAVDDYDLGDSWIETLRFLVDDCSSDVDEYLVERADDPPSVEPSEIVNSDHFSDVQSLDSMDDITSAKSVEEWRKRNPNVEDMIGKMEQLNISGVEVLHLPHTNTVTSIVDSQHLGEIDRSSMQTAANTYVTSYGIESHIFNGARPRTYENTSPITVQALEEHFGGDLNLRNDARQPSMHTYNTPMQRDDIDDGISSGHNALTSRQKFTEGLISSPRCPWQSQSKDQGYLSTETSVVQTLNGNYMRPKSQEPFLAPTKSVASDLNPNDWGGNERDLFPIPIGIDEMYIPTIQASCSRNQDFSYQPRLVNENGRSRVPPGFSSLYTIPNDGVIDISGSRKSGDPIVARYTDYDRVSVQCKRRDELVSERCTTRVTAPTYEPGARYSESGRVPLPYHTNRQSSSIHYPDRNHDANDQVHGNLEGAQRPINCDDRTHNQNGVHPSILINNRQFNSVDCWIDELPEHESQLSMGKFGEVTPSLMAHKWLMNQNLPKIVIPQFKGDPLKWVEFITHFKEMVHEQPCLSSAQRMTYLLQYVEGEARRAVSGFGNDWREYVSALKRLKFMFGRKTRVAQAYIESLTKGKQLKDDDLDGLVNLYFTISDCLSNLRRLEYTADLASTDVVRRVTRQLPYRLSVKWGEHAYRMRAYEEPTLFHLERWLRDRVMATRELHIARGDFQTRYSTLATALDENVVKGRKIMCPMCRDEHHLFRCKGFLEMDHSSRIKFVAKQKLCYNCLKAGHQSKKCRSNCCYIQGCTQKHHTTLHESFALSKCNKVEDGKICNVSDLVKDEKTEERPKCEDPEVKQVSLVNSSKPAQVFCKVVRVHVRITGGKDVETFALLDDGSEGTFIRREFARSIGLHGKEKTVVLSTITDKGESISVENVSFQLISSLPGSKPIMVKNAISLPSNKFHVRSQHLPSGFHTEDRYKHLQGLGFKGIEEEQITILIGLDNYQEIMIRETREGGLKQPIAARTSLGWTIFGSDENCLVNDGLGVNHLKLEETVQSFWETESFGTQFSSNKSMSIEDQVNFEKMKKSTILRGGHLEIGMLWKGHFGILPNNYTMALKRYDSLRNKLQKNPELCKTYKEILKGYVDKGYARKLSEDEINKPLPRIWYLPHHPVLNANKPGKVRLVFDAAAKRNNVCLNDLLCTGPDLSSSLIGALIRFRNYPIAVVADIEAMFHQVWVKEDDSQSLRFLWADDIDSRGTPDVYSMLVHIFGATDSACCANFALRETALRNQSRFSKEAIASVLQNFYVDDMLKSFETEEEAKLIIMEVKKMLSLCGFNLTKFTSNSETALQDLKDVDVKSRGVTKLEKGVQERTLGIIWEINADTFTFTTDIIKEAPLTKRGILTVVSSVYDPMGFLAPFVITAKILLQNLWRRGCSWDENLKEEEKKSWFKWLAELKHVSTFKILRCYINDLDVKSRDLHIFVDASELAFGAVAYMRVCYQTGKVSCRLIISKSRLAPLKTLTVPRLELQAAVLGIRLKNSIMEEISVDIDKVFLWSDSMLTLQYIQNETKRFKIFVANRVSEIREHSKIEQWRHVPGELNPADEMTRGIDITAIGGESRWVNGPCFLYKDEKDWPCSKVSELKTNDAEVKTLITFAGECPLNQFKKLSSWQRLIDIFAWALRFVANTRIDDNSKRFEDYLTVPELNASINVIVKLSQATSFPGELKALQRGDAIPVGSKLSSLCPYVCKDCIIRVGGRLKRAKINVEAKHQIILHADHWVTKLLVTHLHKLNIDEGPELLLGTIRQKFWIICGRRLVKNIIKNCFECKKRRATPCVPLMADLPEYRVSIGCPVFFHCGVDFFGPIQTKFKRGLIKRWGCIFTCMSTRAIHLEVVEGLDSDSFINSLRRFVNRRGSPKKMISDCGSNFKGADAELKKSLHQLNHSKIGSCAAQQEIEWLYNPPDAPHMGGAWERLVQTVKRPLRLMMKDRVLTDFQLLTIFTEIEGLVNSRPLTAVSDNIHDLEALTPNHFILGRANLNIPISVHYDTDACSRKRWKQVQFLSNHFWVRWRKEYLPSLTVRSKWRKEQRNIKEGDLILIVENDVPRSKWNLARVVKTFKGDDGRVRVCEVRTAHGSYVRPVSKLCYLEQDVEGTDESHGSS